MVHADCAPVTLILLLLYGLRVFHFGQVVLSAPSIFKLGAFWVADYVAVASFEEFFLRGYTQFTLARGIGFWPAAVLLSCIFGAIHLRNQGEAWSGALAGVMMGLFLCLTLRRTGDLWFAVGFHSLWDWGESFFYSVPDSGEIQPGHLLSSSLHGPTWLTGGSVGPEASVRFLSCWRLFSLHSIVHILRRRSKERIGSAAVNVTSHWNQENLATVAPHLFEQSFSEYLR